MVDALTSLMACIGVILCAIGAFVGWMFYAITRAFIMACLVAFGVINCILSKLDARSLKE